MFVKFFDKAQEPWPTWPHPCHKWSLKCTSAVKLFMKFIQAIPQYTVNVNVKLKVQRNSVAWSIRYMNTAHISINSATSFFAVCGMCIQQFITAVIVLLLITQTITWCYNSCPFPTSIAHTPWLREDMWPEAIGSSQHAPCWHQSACWSRAVSQTQGSWWK